MAKWYLQPHTLFRKSQWMGASLRKSHPGLDRPAGASFTPPPPLSHTGYYTEYLVHLENHIKSNKFRFTRCGLHSRSNSGGQQTKMLEIHVAVFSSLVLHSLMFFTVQAGHTAQHGFIGNNCGDEDGYGASERVSKCRTSRNAAPI